MSKKDDLLNNNEDKKKEIKPRKKKTEQAVVLKDEIKESNIDQDQYLNKDEIITVELYNEILSTLFNSLSNPIVRNEIKVNENILKYTELQISNLFFLETALSKKLTGQKMAKEFLQLTANITDLALSISKSPKKTRIDILEDRNLLIVTIVNSCKGVERESLEKVRTVDSAALKGLNDQISALSNFTSEEKSNTADQPVFNQDSNSENTNNQVENNNLNNTNIRDLNNNMANLTKLGVLPQHPASSPNFYPYLTKPGIVPNLKKALAGLLILSNLFIIITIIISSFVKGPLTIDINKEPVDFVLSQTNNWLILIMTIILYFSFAYIFIRPTKILREKYRISFFMLGLLFFWLIVTMSYFFWEVSDNYYQNFFLSVVKKEDLNPDVVKHLKALPNFKVFKIFAIITSAICILPLLLVLVLILINPRVDRNKVMRANVEYQNAINAALNGKKYDIDQSLFDHDEPANKDKKRRKANFSGRF
ncbi:hypothetical protein [Spiroplasma platyhelix]|uniref:Transmembrane protein n=1 Tax=Spiroplasma platyhelix PALS-1 TaxID=1276218 RepID=A0A846TX20_9MOLU|nr:hypothetical protein [Spiroplasma platyhelix]MBE4704370.1 hypothetical protein [Spiroplasma platyhelix PALS-1]NKE38742.1 hypothetical protein [Spiroplasma platyhelix PALS-1]UJB28953.1 hypothetical protein SPLAT_v1c01880 [Spiroplasma platyhelix PALS-1]